VLAERATEFIRHVLRFSPQNGRQTAQWPAALSEQADAVTEFRFDELKCLGDSVVVVLIALTETAQFCSSKVLTAWLRH
jgi:hypothetical protein